MSGVIFSRVFLADSGVFFAVVGVVLAITGILVTIWDAITVIEARNSLVGMRFDVGDIKKESPMVDGILAHEIVEISR